MIPLGQPRAERIAASVLLAHTCTTLLGISPRKAYLRCKMERARYLLTNSRMRIKEIAQLVGYPDPYSFSRTFKRECGLAPSHWRQQHGD